MSHVNGWASDAPTPAQLKEFFAQIQSGRITKEILQGFLRGRKDFRIWKTVKLGGFRNTDEVRSALEEARMKIGDYANDILGKTPLESEESEVNLVVLSVAELGFPNGAEYGKICEAAKELGLELCPAEVGAQLRLQYADQPIDEWLIIAMEPIADSDGGLGLFDVVRYGSDLWLNGYYGHSDNFWSGHNRFAFVLPQE